MFDKEMISEARHEVTCEINSNKRQGTIDYRGCDRVCMVMSEQADKAKILLEDGDTETAFMMGSFVYLRAIGIASIADSSSGMLTSVLYEALEILSACAEEAATDKDLSDRLIRFALKESQKNNFDGWDEDRYEYLMPMIPMTNTGTMAEFEKVLDTLLQKDNKREYGEFDAMRNKVVRYKLQRHIYGREAVKKELYDNIQIDELRRVAIDDLAADGEYGKAEALCMEKIDIHRFYRAYDAEDWDNILYQLYKDAGWRDKTILQAKKLLLMGNTDCWADLKEIYEKEGALDREYPAMLELARSCRLRSEYRWILKEEGETELLMLDVEDDPDGIFSYGDVLVGSNAEKVYALCAEKIRKDCADAHERRLYKQVCRLIVKLIGWGGTETARGLIDELKATYPRRPALLDELEKVERKQLDK